MDTLLAMLYGPLKVDTLVLCADLFLSMTETSCMDNKNPDTDIGVQAEDQKNKAANN